MMTPKQVLKVLGDGSTGFRDSKAGVQVVLRHAHGETITSSIGMPNSTKPQACIAAGLCSRLGLLRGANLLFGIPRPFLLWSTQFP